MSAVLCSRCLAVGSTVAAPDAAGFAAPDRRRVDFDRDVRPLLVKHCLTCHGPSKQKGGLRFDRKAAALQGGRQRARDRPGQGGREPDRPVDLRAGGRPGHAAQGAAAVGRSRSASSAPGSTRGPRGPGRRATTTAATGGRSGPWPGRRCPRSPAKPRRACGTRSTRSCGRSCGRRDSPPSPEADRRTLIRRLYFDLIGLPPVAGGDRRVRRTTRPRSPTRTWWTGCCRAPGTASAGPGTGSTSSTTATRTATTRTSRGRTPGPIATTSSAPSTPTSRTASSSTSRSPATCSARARPTASRRIGFIAAGPWDLIGHAEVPETKIDGKVARHLDRDDMVANTINTFLSLTVQCAQCHNHKFDPISPGGLLPPAGRLRRPRPGRSALLHRSRGRRRRPPSCRHCGTALKQERRRLEEAVLEGRRRGPGPSSTGRSPPRAPRRRPRAEFGYHSDDRATPGRGQVGAGGSRPHR